MIFQLIFQFLCFTGPRSVTFRKKEVRHLFDDMVGYRRPLLILPILNIHQFAFETVHKGLSDLTRVIGSDRPAELAQNNKFTGSFPLWPYSFHDEKVNIWKNDTAEICSKYLH